MKRIFLFCFAIITAATLNAQSAFKMPAIDKSPMDMAYFPNNYPVLKVQDKTNEPLVARIIYSRPQKAGRTIFGDLVEYNKVWRMGANEATEVEFYRDVKIGGKKILKGKYTIYAIISADQWTIILNKELDTWGAFKYDEKKDVVRVNVPVEKTTEAIEAFTMVFEKATNGMNLVIAWDDTKVSLPVSLK